MAKKVLVEHLQSHGLPVTFANKVFDRIDREHSGNYICFSGFSQYMHESRAEHRHLFNQIDKDGNGSISLSELKDGLCFLHLESTEVDVNQLFMKIHHDLKGEITFDEFENVFGMLKVEDISYIYSHTHAMFDGGSPALVADYRRMLGSFGIFPTSLPSLSSGPLFAGKYDFYIRMITAGILRVSHCLKSFL